MMTTVAYAECLLKAVVLNVHYRVMIVHLVSDFVNLSFVLNVIPIQMYANLFQLVFQFGAPVHTVSTCIALLNG